MVNRLRQLIPAKGCEGRNACFTKNSRLAEIISRGSHEKPTSVFGQPTGPTGFPTHREVLAATSNGVEATPTRP